MIKRVVSTLCVSCLLATRFFVPVYAEYGEEEEEHFEYIKVDIPYYSYAAYNYFFQSGYNQLYYPVDSQGQPIYNSSGISATETINISSNQNNSTYTESNSVNLSTSESGNIRGSLYAQASTGTGGTTNYNITTGAGSGVGNLPYSDTGSVSGSVTTSGTIQNGNITSTGNSSVSGVSHSQIVYNYELPWLKGDYIHKTSYDVNTAIYINRGATTYLCFYTSKTLNVSGATLNMLNYYTDPNFDGTLIFDRQYFVGNSFCFYSIKITCTQANNTTVRFSIDFPRMDSNTKVIPLYLGNGIDLTDDDKSRFGIETNLQNTIINENNETQTLMTSGDNTSKSAENHVNSSNNTLNNKVSTLEGYESSFNNNLNSSLSNITIPNVNGVVKFGNAARWVSAQYTRIANDQRINFPLIFCLTLGLALTILGRIRT